MKSLIFVFVLFGFLFISQDIAYSQKKTKKIETWEVYASNHQALYCVNNGYTDERCLDRIIITFANNSNKNIRRITFNLEIFDGNGNRLYKKKHTVNIELDAGEQGSTDEIKLKNKIYLPTGNSFDENIRYNTEILSVN